MTEEIGIILMRFNQFIEKHNLSYNPLDMILNNNMLSLSFQSENGILDELPEEKSLALDLENIPNFISHSIGYHHHRVTFKIETAI